MEGIGSKSKTVLKGTVEKNTNAISNKLPNLKGLQGTKPSAFKCQMRSQESAHWLE